MSNIERLAHWQNVYQTKGERDVNWFQKSPRISRDLIRATGAKTDAPIIDIGGGASRLVDGRPQTFFSSSLKYKGASALCLIARTASSRAAMICSCWSSRSGRLTCRCATLANHASATREHSFRIVTRRCGATVARRLEGWRAAFARLRWSERRWRPRRLQVGQMITTMHIILQRQARRPPRLRANPVEC